MAAPPRFPSAAGGAEGLSSTRHALLQAAYSGELRLLKRLVRALDDGRGRPREAAEAAREDGVGALHLAASNGKLEVCRYLAEELRVDVDAADDEGMTPLAYAVICENAAVVKFLLDHGADPDKSDDIGLTPLHSAAGIGDCEMIEMLLAKGAYVDPIADGIGTPLYLATKQRKVGAMKILLDHNADAGAVINSDWISTAMGNGRSTECLKFLLEADANRNAPNGAAVRASARGGVTAPTWRSSGAQGRGQVQRRRREQHVVRGEEVEVKVDPKDEQVNERKISQLKSFASKAIERNDYISASAFYTKAIDVDPNDATLFSNRSLCWLRTGDGPKALLDALHSREMRPDWPKACYRQGAALMLLKDYKSACKALLDGFKLDPENAEMECALREAMESLKLSKGNTEAT